ncbi:type II toxin-antitoxin system tRNA(fMet)-specific endonuclease VapC [Bathymodiolus thermophilus thioautotrophic gill symbiont]|uniref:VapC toxin family PIN domain ribonuclease n=1 Tax=Bathymodiolus thermophilus thioautotrophic gill symbiont TaxID=2360 RepID=A0A1J5TTE6_9GAMM|nr:tRNA(fMet)-specific endonuclease VapC [Bathymodiolus thermophilus thioautotrophic gill symbiont]AYQ57168.1 tRNA(fMet)-specific endonuclease VapC [Bathymodiolus thermophilus thioautotrophic gill symbiont]OIR24131.1 VapC toxin family PIN domain ribonuclease [Bathymodiolus thermophilus thioautotrophic gill symbiont]CAB5498220.1 VapC toxin protein [Bathymodiolus thermophilus thioautotrophic gill symbiont]
MNKYLLDTNICIYVMKRKPIDLLEIFNENAGQMAISSITLSELIHGVEKSQQQKNNRLILEDFVSHLNVLDYTQKSAQQYGIIRADLEKKGVIIGVNDLHIAGHSISEGLILVTNNEKEFKRVHGLKVENWV